MTVSRQIALLQEQLKSPDRMVRMRALVLIVQKGDASIRPFLEKVCLKDESTEIRYYAKKALNMLAQRAVPQPVAAAAPAQAGPAPVAAGAPAAPPAPPKQAPASAKQSPPKPTLPQLHRLLTMGTREKLAAVKFSIFHEIREAVPLMTALFPTEQDPVALSALVMAVGKLGGSAHSGKLVKFLDHENSRVRANTIEALEATGDDAVFPYLIRCLRDDDNRCRANAAKALRTYGPVNQRTTLKLMLESDDVWMQDSAAYVLGFLMDPSAFQLFRIALASPHRVVREQARSALNRLKAAGNERAADLLKRIGGERHGRPEDELFDALSQVSRTGQESPFLPDAPATPVTRPPAVAPTAPVAPKPPAPPVPAAAAPAQAVPVAPAPPSPPVLSVAPAPAQAAPVTAAPSSPPAPVAAAPVQAAPVAPAPPSPPIPAVAAVPAQPAVPPSAASVPPTFAAPPAVPVASAAPPASAEIPATVSAAATAEEPAAPPAPQTESDEARKLAQLTATAESVAIDVALGTEGDSSLPPAVRRSGKFFRPALTAQVKRKSAEEALTELQQVESSEIADLDFIVKEELAQERIFAELSRAASEIDTEAPFTNTRQLKAQRAMEALAAAGKAGGGGLLPQERIAQRMEEAAANLEKDLQGIAAARSADEAWQDRSAKELDLFERLSALS